MIRSTWSMSVSILLASAALAAPPSRGKVPVDETWNLADLYPDDAAWSTTRAKTQANIKKLPRLKKGFTRSAASLRKGLEQISAVEMAVDRLYSYASMKSDQDTRDSTNLGMKQQMEVLATDFTAATAWVDPAVLKAGAKKIRAFIKKDKKLRSVYKPVIDDILRRAPHTLSPGEEKLLADAGLMAGAPENIYGILANADIQFPTVKLSKGEPFTLNQAAYTKYRATGNRKDRIKVFKTFWKTFKGYERTFGVALDAQVKRDMFYARARGYSSTLATALDRYNIPLDVYKNLIKSTHKNLPTLHRYLKLRARMMHIKKLAYHDLYPPLVKAVELNYAYKDGTQEVLQALKPLGDNYLATAKKAMSSRWIDVHPTAGKRSGAYSNGIYDVHPYILLNYNGGYDDVSTLAHELGHTMHSYYSSQTQAYPNAGYAIFVAEVASTTNEAFLIRHMLAKKKDPKVRLYLLGSYLEGLRTTLFRQAMFAEFELAIHEAAEKGEALTGAKLSEMYGKLLRQYYGADQGVCEIDPLYHVEWAYIPHFYYNYYVYQYATGIVAATALSQRVLKGGEQEREDYLGFLKAGSSRYPIDILKSAGVDLTQPQPFEATMQVMNQVMDEIEAILAKSK